MSGENELRPSSWTTDTLKQHYDRRFEDQDKAVQAALMAAEKAVTKAEAASEKRFDSVNEFRKTLSDQTSTFLPRLEYDARHQALEAKVQEVTDRINRSEGQVNGSSLTVGKIYAAIGAVGAVLAIIILIANNVL